MNTKTNLETFIVSQGLNQRQFFEKIHPFLKRDVNKPYHPTKMSNIATGKEKPPAKDGFWEAVQQAFNISGEELQKLQGPEKIDYSTLNSRIIVEEDDLALLLEMKKIMKDRFTFNFAIKTLKEIIETKNH